MASPTTRVLALLELLQNADEFGGADLALYGQADDLHWFTRQLAQVSCGFEVLEPPALCDAIRDSAQRLLRLVEGPAQAE